LKKLFLGVLFLDTDGDALVSALQTTAETGGKRQPRPGPNRIHIRDAIEGLPPNHIIGPAPLPVDPNHCLIHLVDKP